MIVELLLIFGIIFGFGFMVGLLYLMGKIRNRFEMKGKEIEMDVLMDKLL